MQIMQSSHPLIQMRDDAFSAAKQAHARIEHDLSLYRNENYTGSDWIRGFERIVQKPLDPKIPVSVQRLIPAFTEGLPKLEVRPKTAVDYIDVKILERYLEVNEEQDQEALQIQTMVYGNQIFGTAIRYVWYDAAKGIVRAHAINPLSFAPDPAGTLSDFSDSEYVCWRQTHRPSYIERRYPKFDIKNHMSSLDRTGSINVDIVYLRPSAAMDVKIKVPDGIDMVKATIIEDEIYEVVGNPTVWPDFPFSSWKNFLDIDASGRAHAFWGTGYASLIEPLQKVYDDLLANFLFIVRNIKTGRTMSEFGAIDPSKHLNQHGGLLELNQGKRLDQVRELPNPEAPVSLGNAIAAVQEILTQFAPSLSPIFVGESPGANTSGRALSTLQSAAFNQLSDNMRAFSEERKRTARIRMNLIQGHCGYGDHNPRLGSGIGGLLDNSTRHVGFDVTLPDPSGLPQTIAGKIQVLSMLNGMGYQLSPEMVVEMLGLDLGYGLTPEKLISMAEQVSPGGGVPQAGAAAAGVEAVPPVEA